jgi:hypothetical protein
LASTVVHLGSFADAALVVTVAAVSCSINWLIARLPAAARDAMF